MKVLLFTGYGDSIGTPKMKEIMKKTIGIRCRVGEIIEYVENNRLLFTDADEYSMNIAKSMMEDDKEIIVEFKNIQNRYYYKSNEGYISSFSIIDIDTTRPWTIAEYDGAEYVQYLDEDKLVDKELNYWSKCNYV